MWTPTKSTYHLHTLCRVITLLWTIPSFYPSCTPLLWKSSVCSLLLWVCFCFVSFVNLFLVFKRNSTYKWNHVVFAFLCMTYFHPSMLTQMAGFHYFYCWVILHCVCVCVCIYIPHIFLIHLSIDGHLDCFHILAITSNVAMNIGVHISFQTNVFIFWDKYPEVQLLGHTVVLLSALWGIPSCFPQWPHWLAVPPATSGILRAMTNTEAPTQNFLTLWALRRLQAQIYTLYCHWCLWSCFPFLPYRCQSSFLHLKLIHNHWRNLTKAAPVYSSQGGKERAREQHTIKGSEHQGRCC